ncbi:hypothetical protein C8R48DRAFT_693755 [Suillus tomentosus]|nr:hypothetical protein C8R48DRAFT_693755 [Suillus tomentosus]
MSQLSTFLPTVIVPCLSYQPFVLATLRCLDPIQINLSVFDPRNILIFHPVILSPNVQILLVFRCLRAQPTE